MRFDISMKFVTYGVMTELDETQFKPIQNRESWLWVNKPKPHTGLWASPCDSKFGWINWCKREAFSCNFDKKVVFVLNPNARVLEVDSISDLENILENYKLSKTDFNFELLAKDYDAIFLTEKGEEELHFNPYFIGWDCESILILNYVIQQCT